MWWKKERKINFNLIVLGITLVLFGYGVSRMKKPLDNKIYFEGDIKSFCINTSCMEKDGERWWYRKDNEKQPASRDLAENFIDKLRILELGQVVSNNKDKESTFGFGENKYELTVNQKSLLLGADSYVKTPDSDNVFLTNIRVNKEIDFADMTITNWPSDKITKIVATNGNRETNISIEDKIFVNKVSRLMGIKYLAEIDKNKAKALKFVINDGEYQLIIGQNGNIYFATSDEENYFEISRTDYFALKSKVR